MVHGHPDYGLSSAKRNVYAVTDLGELAARLASIVRWDRRGDVVYMDDFEGDVLEWDHAGQEADPITIEHAHSGSQAVKLTTRAVLYDWAYIEKYFTYPREVRLGFEHWGILVANQDRWRLHVSIDDGVTGQYEAGFYYNPSNGQIYLYTGVPTWTLIGTVTPLQLSSGGIWAWHPSKLVLDNENWRYVQLLVGYDSFDISSYTINRGATSGSERMYVDVMVRTGATAAISCYIDDFILTQNEP
jgi:hypothetical protein